MTSRRVGGDEQRRELERQAVAYSLLWRDVVRAKAVPLAAEALSNAQIAERSRRQSVSEWRKRFFDECVAGSRSARGRDVHGLFPRRRSPLACELPTQRGVSLSRWSNAELAREAVRLGIVAEIRRSLRGVREPVPRARRSGPASSERLVVSGLVGCSPRCGSAHVGLRAAIAKALGLR